MARDDLRWCKWMMWRFMLVDVSSRALRIMMLYWNQSSSRYCLVFVSYRVVSWLVVAKGGGLSSDSIEVVGDVVELWSAKERPFFSEESVVWTFGSSRHDRKISLSNPFWILSLRQISNRIYTMFFGFNPHNLSYRSSLQFSLNSLSIFYREYNTLIYGNHVDFNQLFWLENREYQNSTSGGRIWFSVRSGPLKWNFDIPCCRVRTIDASSDHCPRKRMRVVRRICRPLAGRSFLYSR